MKRQIFCTVLFSAAVAVGAAAQTGTPPSTGAQADKDQMTISGCLQQGSGSGSTGTSGTATSGSNKPSGSEFVLTNATAAARGASGTGTSGGATASGASATSYKLSGGNQNDLKKYVNSQVEIRGRVEHSSASSGSTAGGTASRSSDQSMPTLRVSSVRQIASSCAGQ